MPKLLTTDPSPEKSASEPAAERITLFHPRMGNIDMGRDLHKGCTTCVASFSSSSTSGPHNTQNGSKFSTLSTRDAVHPRCGGHFGIIRLPLRVCHPVVAPEVLTLLRVLCWHCQRLRCGETITALAVQALQCADHGHTQQGESVLEDIVFRTAKITVSGAKREEVIMPEETNPGLCSSATMGSIQNVLEKSNCERAGGGKTGEVDNYGLLLRGKIIRAVLKRSMANKCVHCNHMQPRDIRLLDNVLYFTLPQDKRDIPSAVLDRISRELKLFRRSFAWLSPDEAFKLLASAWSKEAFIRMAYPPSGVLKPWIESTEWPDHKPDEWASRFLPQQVLVPPNHTRYIHPETNRPGSTVDTVTQLLSNVIRYSKEYTACAHSEAENVSILKERAYKQLQATVNMLYEEKITSFTKKEGLFRSNMMGKRVNQACRTVITPDSYIFTNQLCLPRRMAVRMTFPDSMSLCSDSHRALLTKCITNGTMRYPGCTHVEIQKDGHTETIALAGKERHLKQIAARMLTHVAMGGDVILHRHLMDGDVVLFNRQPTLHKPSIVGKRIIVRGNDYTVRFHYATCKGFNADFDGDEMNCHVPQSVAARVEALTLMDANLQYYVPSSGQPIRGLIQDHIVGAFLLSSRGRTVTRTQFGEYLYAFAHPMKLTISLPTPHILKPCPLWSGKQVFSEALRLTTSARHSENDGLSLRNRSHLSASFLRMNPTDQEDGTITIQSSELLAGVLDKANMGSCEKSFIQYVVETYGHSAGGMLLSGLGRMLTVFCRTRGFSLNLDDVLLKDDLVANPKLNKSRSHMLQNVDNCSRGSTERTVLRSISELTDVMNRRLFPHGTYVSYPRNSLLLMTLSGSRGSASNATQMSVCLAQQLFDHQRIRPMASEKVLPCVFPQDQRARARGFVRGRFLSGVHPGEYFIHAAAGRDGIIDTAIKTARSGYLQRGLVKGMETTTLHWDETVRTGEGEVLQFKYGGDGLDPCKSSSLAHWEFVARNATDLRRRYASLIRVMKDTMHVGLRGLRNGMKGFSPSDKLKPFVDEQRNERQWKKEIRQATSCRLLHARCDPGEPVGIIAAQSIGELSTQMTLNTFHHAGTSIAHVTEGIPRLRELLTYANVSEPTIVLPIKNIGATEQFAFCCLREILTPLKMYDALSGAARVPYRHRSVRRGSYCEIELDILFSVTELENRRSLLGASPHTFCEDFIYSAQNLFRSAVLVAHRDIRKSGILRESSGAEEDNSTAGGNTTHSAAHQRSHTNESSEEATSDAVPHRTESHQDTVDDIAQFLECQSSAFSGNSVHGNAANTERSKTPHPAQVTHPAISAEGAVQGGAPPFTQWARSAITISLSRSGICVRAKNFRAHSYDTERDCFVLSGSLTLPVDAVVAVDDILTHSLREVSLSSSKLDYSGEISHIDLLRSRTDSSGEIAIKGTAAKLSLALRLRSWMESILFRTPAERILEYSHKNSLDCPCPDPIAPFCELSTLPPLTPASIEWHRIFSTDPNDMAETFGIESATNYLVTDMVRLLQSYKVDLRHITVLADTATHTGKCLGFHRTGIVKQAVSMPFYQMTFETGGKFLHDGVVQAVQDRLHSFSGSLIVGRSPKVGTNMGEVMLEREGG